MTEDEKSKWKRWTAILGERTAFKHDVADAPTITAEPVKHGRWIWKDHYLVCSECGEENDRKNYCPNCGAKMFDKDTDVPDKNVGKIDEVEE